MSAISMNAAAVTIQDLATESTRFKDEPGSLPPNASLSRHVGGCEPAQMNFVAGSSALKGSLKCTGAAFGVLFEISESRTRVWGLSLCISCSISPA